MAITRVLSADFLGLQNLEALIRDLGRITQDQRNRLLIVCSEIFDNILVHSDTLVGRKVFFRLKMKNGICAAFWFKAGNFRRFAESGGKPVGVHFDADSGRHRGLGLIMCSNLASAVYFRPGKCLDSVIIKI